MLDMLYQFVWNSLMNVTVAAIAVFLVRAVCLLRRKYFRPHIWGLVFLAAFCPLELFVLPDSGYAAGALFDPSMKFYFFLAWEGVAVLLLAARCLRCRRRKWRSLDCVQVEENAYLMKGISRTMVCGFFHPVIYLPEGLDEELQQAMLERKHRLIASGGQKLLTAAAIVACLFWFHPVLWLSFYYMKEDMKRL